MGEQEPAPRRERVLEALAPERVRAVLSPYPASARRWVAMLAASQEPTPTVVSLNLEATADGDGLEALLDGLSTAAMEVYPDWYAGVALRFERARFPRTEVEVRLEEARARSPEVSGAWLRAAWRRARAGKAPRLPQVSRAVEARQLALAIDPDRLLLLLLAPEEGEVDRLRLAREASWLALQTRAPVLLFVPATWRRAADLDSVMDDVIELEVDEADGPSLTTTVAAASVVVEPPIGRPHALSTAEQRLYDALQRAPDLRGVFRFNQRLDLDAVTTPRVDVLWPEGRFVVEVDGPEHRAASRYRLDRRRDYGLLVAGYAVLRVTNEDVLEDIERVLQMIRSCVALRRGESPT
jgi:very-short-patch-repair endonuclease